MYTYSHTNDFPGSTCTVHSTAKNLVSVHIQGLHVSNVCKIMHHIPEHKSTHMCIHAYIPVHAHACSCQGVYVHESTIQMQLHKTLLEAHLVWAITGLGYTAAIEFKVQPSTIKEISLLVIIELRISSHSHPSRAVQTPSNSYFTF